MPEKRSVTQADSSAYSVRMIERLAERLERCETNLLNAFRDWDLRFETSTNADSLLLKSFGARLAFVEQRLITVKQRVSQLERGK